VGRRLFFLLFLSCFNAISGAFFGRTVSSDIICGMSLTIEGGTLVEASCTGASLCVALGKVGFMNLSLNNCESNWS
jgi:hypothetical protein